MKMKHQCQKQVGVRPTLKYNAVTIPVAVICAHNAVDGSRWCERHQYMDDIA